LLVEDLLRHFLPGEPQVPGHGDRAQRDRAAPGQVKRVDFDEVAVPVGERSLRVARPLRSEFPGAIHHVISPGNDRQPIVCNDVHQRKLSRARQRQQRIETRTTGKPTVARNHRSPAAET